MLRSIVSLRQLVENQEFEALKASSLAWLLQFPEDTAVKVLLALARAHLKESDTGNDLSLLYKQAQDSFDQDALCDLAAVYIVQQDLKQASELLKSIIKLVPKHDLALVRLAGCYMAQGERQKALMFFERSLMFCPQRISAQLNRIELLTDAYRVFLQENNLDLNDLDNQSLMQSENLATVTVAFEETFALLLTQKNTTPKKLWQNYEMALQHLQLQWWVTLENYALAEEWLYRDAIFKVEASIVYWSVAYATLLAEHDQHDMAESFLKEILKNHPQNMAILLLLSDLAKVKGNIQYAVACIKKAIKQDEQNMELWCRLSDACLFTAIKLARHAAEKANELACSDDVSQRNDEARLEVLRLRTKTALAMVEYHDGAFDKAERLFLEVLADRPYFVPALSGLGQQWMQQGQIDDAVSLFEKVKEVDPISGFTSLINARRFPDDESALEKLEKSAKIPSLQGSLRTNVLFQLASVWEKRKNYKKAFEFAKQANEATSRTLKYDPKNHRQRDARIRYAFSSSLFKHRKNSGVSSSLPVFVVGMPRSGTTLVEQIIAGHSDIFGAGELGVIPDVIQGLNRWERHVGSGRQYPDCIDDVSVNVSKGIAENVLKELKIFSPDSKHIVDKLPHNFENIGLIKFLFPNARIISVRRDPRDIALSNYFTDYQAKHGGMGFAYDLTHIGEQLADHNLMMDHWHQVFPDQILEIHYEDVLGNLEGSARKMLDYIGVDWQPEVLKFNELERSVKTASVWQVRQPLYKTSKAKWRHYKDKLAPLIKATNKPIEFEAIDMLTLPVAGFLTKGVAHFRKGELDDAETCFKKMLHHNPDHAACQYMTGLVYFRKGCIKEGIPLVESALKTLPWKRDWRDSLVKAYNVIGQTEKALDAQKEDPFGQDASPTDTGDDVSHSQKAELTASVKDNKPLFALVGVEQFL